MIEKPSGKRPVGRLRGRDMTKMNATLNVASNREQCRGIIEAAKEEEDE